MIRSSTFPDSKIFPLFITINSFATASISDTICVDNKTIFFLDKLLIKLEKFNRSLGSKPAVGSSNIKISGLFKIACAIPIRLFIPPEYVLIFLCDTSDKFTISNTSEIFNFNSCFFIPFNAPIYSKKSIALKPE